MHRNRSHRLRNLFARLILVLYFVVFTGFSVTHAYYSDEGKSSGNVITAIDWTAPESSVTTYLGSYQNSHTFLVPYTSTDAVSKVKSVTLYYKFGESGLWTMFAEDSFIPEQTHNASFSFTSPNGDGTYYFYTIAKDIYDNEENPPLVPDVSTIVDTVKPITILTIGDPKYTNSVGTYVNTGTTFSLSATDATSGVDKTTYRIDSGSITTYTTPFSLTDEGIHTIYYGSSDKAGNIEDNHEQIVILDKTAPSSQIDQAVLTGYQNTLSFNIPTSQSDPEISAGLPGSGVAKLHLFYRKDDIGSFVEYGSGFTIGNVNFTAIENGEYEFYTRAEDNVGNLEEDITGGLDKRIVTTIVDIVSPPAPVLTVYSDNSPGVVLTNDTYYKYPLPYFTWPTVVDGLSGLNHYHYYFGTDNSALLTSTLDNFINSFNLSTALSVDTTYYFKIKAEDMAGNFSATASFIYKYDSTGPVISGINLDPASVVANGSNSVTMTATIIDYGSGVGSVNADLSAVGLGTAVPYTSVSGNIYSWIFTPLSSTTIGAKTITINTKDNLDNASTSTATLTITSSVSPAETVTIRLQAVADSYMNSDKPDENKGDRTEMFVKSKTGEIKRSIVRFDLSVLPPGSTITSCNLNLYLNDGPNTSRTYGAYRINNHETEWTETGVTWNKFNSGSSWGTSGGDYSSSTTANLAINNGEKNKYVNWNVTTDCNALAQRAWLIKDNNEGTNTEVKFKTKEEPGFDEDPYLEITYSTPAVTTNHLVINEVSYDVGSGKGTELNNEWVEIYNPTASSANISGWKICDYHSCDTIPTSTPIPAYGFAVISPESSTWSYWSIPGDAIKIVLGSHIGDGLNNDHDRVILKNSSDLEIDAVSYGDGTDTYAFNPVIANIEAGWSFARLIKGYDNDRASDFWYNPSPNPGTNPDSTVIITPSPTPIPTREAVIIETPIITLTPTITPEATLTPTIVPTITDIPIVIPTITPTITPEITLTPTLTPIPTIIPQTIPIPTETSSPVPTETPVPTPLP